MKNIIKIITILFILTRCSKTEVQGYVYSKNGFPISNGTVILNEKKNADGHVLGNDKTVTSTDNNGFYSFKFKWKFNKSYRVKCKSDSGLALSIPIRDKKTNTIILDTY